MLFLRLFTFSPTAAVSVRLSFQDAFFSDAWNLPFVSLKSRTPFSSRLLILARHIRLASRQRCYTTLPAPGWCFPLSVSPSGPFYTKGASLFKAGSHFSLLVFSSFSLISSSYSLLIVMQTLTYAPPLTTTST